MGPVSQKLLLWGVQLAGTWIQTASVAHGMWACLCHSSVPLSLLGESGRLCIQQPVMQGAVWGGGRPSPQNYKAGPICILVSSSLCPPIVHLPSIIQTMSLPWPQVQILALTFTSYVILHKWPGPWNPSFLTCKLEIKTPIFKGCEDWMKSCFWVCV